ncbi:plexin domain-containing protein 2-like isoform X2 [Dendronephthya gigantea]|uniref:plexin domain-containing protein 2-like isoform X2 n=1 Tax=Dendronephthya gigantea TaxID=151771 RepID=UPI00106CAE1B|nr:plexin domain-containing protein 2-like isoform X2 [Dendronephthya gigantea]
MIGAFMSYVNIPRKNISVIIEISELIEDFQEVPKAYLTEKHEIVRRDVVQPNISTISPSQPTQRITPLSQKQSTLQPKLASTSLSSPMVKPNKTVTSVSKTVSLATAKIPSSHVTTEKPYNSTTQSQTTNTENQPKTPTKKPSTTTLPTKIEKDDHKYYRSQHYSNGKKWWFDLDGHSNKTILHKELSENIKFSFVLRISFDFPYYGHLIRNVTITNKGYLFLGERLHVFNASAQYAAPLMADFGADLHNKTSIRYIDTGDRFTVEWANMQLKNQFPGKEFSFQCSILKNGSLIFAYKEIPVQVKSISTSGFFVRVGLSDTYRIEKIGYNVRYNNKIYRKVRFIIYYLYHKVQLEKNKVLSGSAFVLTPVPNCVMFNSCDDCVNTRTAFKCKWCPKIKRCSDGIDRHRQSWLNAGCTKDSVESCSSDDSSKLSGGEIAVIVILPLLVMVIVAWFVYAYFHPQTKSGLCLIEYGNPTKWCRNSSGETRSTSTDGRISFKTMPFESNS